MTERTSPIPQFLADGILAKHARVRGTAIYLVRNADLVPQALLLNLRHNRVIHERVVLLALRTESSAHVSAEQRVHVEPIGENFYRVIARHGFAESANVPSILARLAECGLEIDLAETSFFLGRENLLPTARPGMALWRERLFARLSRNAQGATKFFRLPPDNVCEMGVQIEL